MFIRECTVVRDNNVWNIVAFANKLVSENNRADKDSYADFFKYFTSQPLCHIFRFMEPSAGQVPGVAINEVTDHKHCISFWDYCFLGHLPYIVLIRNFF